MSNFLSFLITVSQVIWLVTHNSHFAFAVAKDFSLIAQYQIMEASLEKGFID